MASAVSIICSAVICISFSPFALHCAWMGIYPLDDDLTSGYIENCRWAMKPASKRSNDKMEIKIEVPAARISNMMISAIESGDPVTTASKGGWCVSIETKSRKPFSGNWWYADAAFFEGGFNFNVVELDDESTGHETKHYVTSRDVARGLAVMAKGFPRQFAQILNDDTDAPCADIFLQCILFGEEKYA